MFLGKFSGQQTSSKQNRADFVARATEVCRAASSGNLEPRITGIEDAGELSELLLGINDLLDLTNAFVREAAASMDYASQDKYFRKIILRGLPGEFRRSAQMINDATAKMQTQREEIAQQKEQQMGMAKAVEKTIEAVADSAQDLLKTAGEVDTSATETSERSAAVAAATEEASTNVQTVASATEELSASISEITQQVSHQAKASTEVQGEAERAGESVGILHERAERITEVVQLINEIADRTNLLALNATIEAARAGEAGKGFAVVASEVKSLANQTAKATEDIGSQIADIRGAAGNVVEVFKTIGKMIGSISEGSAAIASAIEEQSATTQEISRNVQQASQGTDEVSQNIVGVNETAQRTGTTAKHQQEAANELARHSANLQQEAVRFLEAIGAA